MTDKRHTDEQNRDDTLGRLEGTRQADKAAIGFFQWLETSLKRTTLFGGVCVLAASLIGWIGGRIVSPGEQTRALEAATAHGFSRQDSIRTVFAAEQNIVDSVQTDAIEDLRREMAESRTSDRFQTYALCIITRRMDPTITPPECGAVIQSYRRR